MFTFTRSSVLKTLFFGTIIGIVLAVTACSHPTEPTPTPEPAVSVNLKVELVVANIPENATLVMYIGKVSPADGHFGGFKTCESPASAGPIFSCGTSVMAPAVYAFRANYFQPQTKSVWVCDGATANGTTLVCSGKDPIAAYAPFKIDSNGSVPSGGLQ